MAYVHVAHDVARRQPYRARRTPSTFGGHVTVEDWAVIGASSGVHQFCRVGRHAIVGGYSVITQDVLPFSNTVTAREAKVFGANATGLKRRGFSPESIDALHKAFRLLTRAGLNTTQARANAFAAEVASRRPKSNELLAFIRTVRARLHQVNARTG